jgi:hypothetical protein
MKSDRGRRLGLECNWKAVRGWTAVETDEGKVETERFKAEQKKELQEENTKTKRQTAEGRERNARRNGRRDGWKPRQERRRGHAGTAASGPVRSS